MFQKKLNSLLVSVCTVGVLFVSNLPSQESSINKAWEDDTVLVTKNGNKTEVQALQTKKVLYKSHDPQLAIEWGMNNARTTVVLPGQYNISDRVDVPRDDVTLIISEGATISLNGDTKAQHTLVTPGFLGSDGKRYPVYVALYNQRNHFRFLNFGNCIAMFDGRNEENTYRVKGGLWVSTGSYHSHPVSWNDCRAVQIPLAISKQDAHAVVSMEGCKDISVGTVIHLAGQSGGKAHEVVDLNSRNRDITIDRLIGERSLEMIDCNESFVVVDEFLALGKPQRWITGSNGSGARYTIKPPIRRHYIHFNEKTLIEDVSSTNVKIHISKIPESLPSITIWVTIEVHFNNGKKKKFYEKVTFDVRSKKELFQILKEGDPKARDGAWQAEARVKAWQALVYQVDEGDLDQVLNHLVPGKIVEMEFVYKCLQSIGRQTDDKLALFNEISKKYKKIHSRGKSVVLRMARMLGTPQALTLVRSGVKSYDDKRRRMCLSLLGAWPNQAPADDLLKFLNNSTDRIDREIALMGYIRLAGLMTSETTEVGRTAGRRIGKFWDSGRSIMLIKAMQLAKSIKAKKAILNSARHIWTFESLKIVAEYRKDPELREEAEWAAESLVYELRGSNSEEVWELVKSFSDSSNPRLKARLDGAISVRRDLKPHIRNWMFAGPYSFLEKSDDLFNDLHNMAFDPETKPRDVKWTEYNYLLGTRIHQWLGHSNDSLKAGYLKTHLISPSDQQVCLELTSDDSLKVWLNRKLVHDNPKRRSLGEWDKINISLNKGRNELLLKISNYAGKWGFGCKVMTLDGSKAVEGLKVDPFDN